MRARSNSTRLEHIAVFPSKARWLINGRSIRSARRPLLNSRPTIRSWESEYGCAHCILRCERSVPRETSEFSDALGAQESLKGNGLATTPCAEPPSVGLGGDSVRQSRIVRGDWPTSGL